MKRALLAVGLMMAMPVHAAPAIRALFVGIDRYHYSSARIIGANFKDLRGAVGDVGRIKDGLRAMYRLDLDRASGATCRSVNIVSTTLTNDCATRDAILMSLREQIAASASGDTVLFYFAGHGSRLVEEGTFDQAKMLNSSILPTDARDPKAPAAGDILDRELRGEIDAATVRGVNVVTLFDSCNSGTGTRGSKMRVRYIETARDAPPVAGSAVRPPPPPLRGAGGGYRVHLAGAEDWQASREVTPIDGGETRGVFTTALLAAMRAGPAATFGDLAYATARQIATLDVSSQTPHAEGALNATLGGPDRPTPLFEVVATGNALRLTSGRLSGITSGSRFALFASAADALRDGAVPIADATAGTPDAYGATLALAGRPAMPLPDRLVARETQHVWSDSVLNVSASSSDPDQQARIAAALIQSPAIRFREDRGDFVVGPDAGGMIALTDRTGRRVADLGALDTGFEDRLAVLSERVARAEALVSLVNSTANTLCVAPGDYDVADCPPLTTGPQRIVGVNETLRLTVANRAASDRHVYVLSIGPNDAIALLIPRNGGTDPAMPPDQPQQRTIALGTPGRYRFVAITSGSPINAVALEQAGAGARGVGVPPTTDWTATLVEIIVRQGTCMGHRGRIAALPCLMLTLAGAASQTVMPSPPSAMVPPPASDLQEDDGRIVGGIAADPNSAPWQAEIYSTYAYTADDLASDARLPPDERAYLAAKSPWERAHRCGAVYIGDGWLLSAAHCFAGIRADPLAGWRIRLGAYDLSRPDDGMTYAIERVAVHRGFTGAAPYVDDIALLHVVADTRTRARPDAPVQAIRLAGPNDRPIAAYEWLRVTGWGSTKPRDAVPGVLARDGSINRAAAILQQIDIRLQTPACATVPAYRAVRQATQICAGRAMMGAALASRMVGEFALSPVLLDRTVQDSCNGDSGGPMTRLIGKQRVLVGLVSWGRGCGMPGVPGIYTRIAAYLPWIESTRRLSRPGVMDRY